MSKIKSKLILPLKVQQQQQSKSYYFTYFYLINQLVNITLAMNKFFISFIVNFIIKLGCKINNIMIHSLNELYKINLLIYYLMILIGFGLNLFCCLCSLCFKNCSCFKVLKYSLKYLMLDLRQMNHMGCLVMRIQITNIEIN